MNRPAVALAAAAAATAVLAGCETTAEKSARLEASGNRSIKERGLSIREVNRAVQVGETTVLTDPNGTAAVVELQTNAPEGLAKVPIALTVKDGKDRPVFKNDTPGLEPSLVSVPVLERGKPFYWINDLIVASGKPVKAEVKIGQADPIGGDLPQIEVGEPKLVQDPVSGVAATGKVKNLSQVEQKQLVLFGIARKGKKIVAAGRAQIPRLKPGKDARYNVYFIGNPRGADLEVVAPPSVLN